jgi:inorganic phosphate transporter, PiT family
MFLLLLAGGVLYVAYNLYGGVSATGARTTTFLPYLLLVFALPIALGYESVDGFHDTANAVTHLTYGRGAAAELVAAGTIAAADMYDLPVSTTHILSSGVTGTMAANGSACSCRRSAI